MVLIDAAPLFQRLPFGWSLLFLFNAITVLGILLFYVQTATKQMMDEKRAGRITYIIRIVLSLWLAVAYLVAEQGWLSFNNGLSGIAYLTIFTGALLILPIALPSVHKGLLFVPLAAPVLVNALRILQEVALWQYAESGHVPAELTLMGANLDVHLGATALFVAVALYSGAKFGRMAAYVWNILGISITLATIGNGWVYASQAGAENVLAAFPMVWLPSFLWPFWLMTHIVSLWLLKYKPEVPNHIEGTPQLKLSRNK